MEMKMFRRSPRRRKTPEIVVDNELRISEAPTGLVVAGGE
jgi:hypothetical protein